MYNSKNFLGGLKIITPVAAIYFTLLLITDTIMSYIKKNITLDVIGHRMMEFITLLLWAMVGIGTLNKNIPIVTGALVFLYSAYWTVYNF